MARATRKVDIPPEVRPVVAAAAKNLASHLWGAQGPAWGTSFASLEELTAQIAESLGSQLMHQALRRQAEQPPPEHLQACPACKGPLDEGPPSRAACRPPSAPPTGKSRPATAPAAGGLFPPQSKGLGIDRTEHSPAVQEKVVFAGVAASSFAKGPELPGNLAELGVPTEQVERLTRATGSERVARRDEAVAAFTALPLVKKFDAPKGAEPPELAVVQVDGGRLQVRERDDAQAQAEVAPPVTPDGFDEDQKGKGLWREDKLGVLLEMRSKAAAADPCPEAPPGFVDALRIRILARQMGKVAAGPDGDGTGPPESAPADGPDGAGGHGPGHEPPEVKHRRVVAACRPRRSFALLVASAAWAAGFHKAKRKAFVADGSANNWRLHGRFFSPFTAALGFIHALSYVHAAAMAGRSFERGWKAYARWISWVWKGQVKRVIKELSQRQEEVGLPQEGESETSVASVVARGLGYLRNHRDKMRYDAYRKAGLPITSAVMESTVKQMNQRVRGTEKFWCSEGAEAIVQLRADYLSDDQPLDGFFQRRQRDASGQRPYRRAAAA